MARVARARSRFCSSSCTRGRKRSESNRVKPRRSIGRPRRLRGCRNQPRAQATSSGGVVSSSRLALWMTVNSKVPLLMPRVADLRVMTSGPKAVDPNFRGPQFTTSQGSPARLGAGLPGGPGLSRNSLGGRCRLPGGVVLAGSRAPRSPTARARAIRPGRLRRQSRRGRPLARVISSSRPTKARRQKGPARIGVSRKARVQANLRRGSSRCSQPPLGR